MAERSTSWSFPVPSSSVPSIAMPHVPMPVFLGRQVCYGTCVAHGTRPLNLGCGRGGDEFKHRNPRSDALLARYHIHGLQLALHFLPSNRPVPSSCLTDHSTDLPQSCSSEKNECGLSTIVVVDTHNGRQEGIFIDPYSERRDKRKFMFHNRGSVDVVIVNPHEFLFKKQR